MARAEDETMRTFEAHSDGAVLVPDEPVHLSPGARYRVALEPIDAPAQGLPLAELAIALSEQMEGDYPPDLARNHDHYLYGRPKR
jgi:hypothetical protein